MVSRTLIISQEEVQNVNREQNGLDIQEYININNERMGRIGRIINNGYANDLMYNINEFEDEYETDSDNETDSDDENENNDENDSDDENNDENNDENENENDIVNEEYDMNIIDEARFVVGNDLFNKNIRNILSDLEEARWNLLERLRFVEAFYRDRQNDYENEENYYYEERPEDIEFDELENIINEHQRLINRENGIY